MYKTEYLIRTENTQIILWRESILPNNLFFHLIYLLLPCVALPNLIFQCFTRSAWTGTGVANANIYFLFLSSVSFKEPFSFENTPNWQRRVTVSPWPLPPAKEVQLHPMAICFPPREHIFSLLDICTHPASDLSFSLFAMVTKSKETQWAQEIYSDF